MMEPKNNTFQSPVKVNAGLKALAHIPVELAAMGAERPLLITTKILAKKKAISRVMDGLRDSGMPLGIYDGLGEHARLKTVLHLAELFQDGGFDAVMALGGGPVMHTAKALNLAVSENTRDLTAFAVDGDATIGHLKPFMAIPAASGDGYETTSRAFVEDLPFESSNLMPDLVVVDPVVFMREPPLNVISAAMTALTHAVEGFVGPEKNPFTDGYAHTAVRILMQHLVDALSDDRGWRNARSHVATAETMAGTVFSNVSPGLTHVLAAAVAEKTGSLPGLCMGILLPYVLDHLSTREDYFVDSLLLPVAGPETFAITAGELRTGKVLTLIQELQFELHESTRGELPMNLEDLGLKRDQLKPLAASETHGAPKVVNGEGRLMILERALQGDPIDVN